MSPEVLWEALKKDRRWLAVCVAALLILSLSISVYYIQSNKDLEEPIKATLLAVLSVLGNLAATVIVFAVASKLFSSEDSEEHNIGMHKAVAAAISVPKDLSQIPWAQLIDNA